MRLGIVSGYTTLAGDVAEALRSQASDEIAVRAEATSEFELRHHPEVLRPELGRVLRAIRPLEPELVADETLARNEAALHLGDRAPLGKWRVKVVCESAEARKALSAGFRKLGFSMHRADEEPQPQDRLQYGGATAFARGVVRWRLARAGCRPVEVQQWGEDDPDIFVRMVDPALRHLSPAERLPVEVRCDDPKAALAVGERLRAAGFPRTEIGLPGDGGRGGCGRMLAVDPGPLGALGQDVAAAMLMAIAAEAAAEAGIDPNRYPVRSTKTASAKPVLDLPLDACRSGRLPPYAGPYPERFRVTLLTDDRRAAPDLIREFSSRGFGPVTRRSLDAVTEGFRISYGALASEPTVLEAAREAVEAHMNAIGADAFLLVFQHRLPPESTEIIVQVPSAAFKDGSLTREMENPVLYNAYIRGGGTEITAAVTKAVKGLGFTTVEPRDRPTEGAPRLGFGAAPRALLDRIRVAVKEATGLLLPLVREGSVTSRDIWLVLPAEPPAETARERAAPARSSGTRRVPPAPGAGRTFISVGPDYVDIGGRRMARRLDCGTAHVPRPEWFRPYCVDAVTAATFSHNALAVAYRETCALEGPTGTSKTSSILYMAGLLNQPVLRLNLNGHADTGDLIGRYVPAEKGGWRFHEGLLVTAMRNGYWLILDELNLAEASVLERLNPVLERHPTLVLTEHDNSVIEAPNEHFRIFATLNPVDEYVGREAMSPALRDRWAAYRYVPRPGESEYLALARLAVFGAQPAITIGDESFDGFDEAAPLARLSSVRRIDDFLSAFARFQVSAEAASEPDESGASRLGAGRRERYVFSRRGFMNVLSFMERVLDGERQERRAAVAGWQAIERYYLNKLASPADRSTATDLAAAAGISADKWAFPQ